MQLFSRKKTFALLSLGALAALGACGDDVTVSEPTPPPVTVTITPPSANMNVGESLNFAVQISGGPTTNAPTLASCTSSNTAVATAAVSGSACRVTAVAAGNATVTAAASTGQVAAASITVNAPAAAITGLQISPTSSNIAVGQSVTIVPTVNRAASSVTVAYTYTSSSNAIATVNANGVVTAVAPGVATITVTATGTGTGYSSATLTGASTVTVAALPQGITSLNVQPTQLAIALGSTAQLSASAQQPSGAAAATITYGTTVPAVATVSNTGLVTAVAPGTAVITVTATSAANANFAASTLTQLVPVTVSPSANVTIQTITQGPISTSYVNNTDGLGGLQAGILSSNNTQVNQPIDITNVRDQIQVVVNLQPNGQRVDSVVAFVANADGSNRRAAARQLYSNGTANAGDITLFVNTADFTVDFTAGTADVFYPNGQKLISVSVFTTEGTTARELQNAVNNRQTVNFNNIDGYAARYTNPTRTANNPANGLNWWGGPGAEGQGSATIVPVFYTAGRQITNLTLGMRQGLTFTTAICDQAGQAIPGRTGQGVSTESYTAAPFRATYDASIGRMVASSASSASNYTTAGNGNIECLGYEHPAADQQNIMGVIAATDNQNNGAPLVTFANGYRFSTAVARPVANRLDYNAPTTTTPDIRRASPSVTGWVNASFNFQSNTDASTDGGVGTPGARTWYYKGAGSATSPACGDTNWVAMPNATGADIPECATNLIGGWDGVNGTTRSGSPYRALYTEADRLQNTRTSAGSDVFGVDKTVPLIRFSTASRADTAIVTTLSGATTFQAEFIDERAGFIDGTELVGAAFPAPTKSSTGTIGTLASTVRAQAHVASRAGGFNTNVTTTKAICINPNALTTALLATNGSTLNAGATFLTAPNCATVTPTSAVNIGQTSDGYRIGHAAQLESSEGLYHYLTFARDRAGNVTETIRRRVAVQASSPTIADVLMPATVSASAAPVIGYNAQDNVEIRATTLANTYGGLPSSNVLRYPQTLVDPRFNDNVNSPVAGAQASVTVPAPFIFGVATTFGGANTLVQTSQLQIWNVANNQATSAASGFITQGIPTLNTFNAGTGGGYNSWSVLPSRDAGFNAPEGLKAQLVSNTNVTNQAFVRVDFFRLSAATADFGQTHWQYLGSANTAATADVGTLGTDRAFTFTLPDAQYAKRPNSLETTQSPAGTGDVILAIGVRANGAGLATTGTIGGQAIQINIAGLPAGAQANVQITNGSGYVQNVTGSGIYTVPAAGTYFVTGQTTTFNNQQYSVSTIAPSGTVNVTANSVAGPITVTYVPATTALQVQVSGIVGGGSHGFVISGPNGFTQNITQGNGTSTYTVPGIGAYTVTPNNAGGASNIGAYNHTIPAAVAGLNVQLPPTAAPVAAFAFVNNTNHIQWNVSGLPTGATPLTSACFAGSIGNGNQLFQTIGNAAACTLAGASFFNGANNTFYTTTFANPYAASTAASAPTYNVTYTAQSAQITVNPITIGGGGNNLPNGIPFTVRLTSSVFASQGGFADFSGTTGTPLVIPVAPGVYNVSISRTLVVGNQTWNIATVPADVAATGGTTAPTIVTSGPNAVVQNITISGAPTAVADIQATITPSFTGPIATP
ncbi:Ig-like domain-containing protein [Gemmatimonas sp. UBA7669]|uniref:Ig-like domain-containing protein n=1 Tax=Gemmatimonas sp. UBA7669 TaxID=1946568 RepID=UPI0025C266AD|nr:Ig-like domain-containing protein [Gemmatimonas sp. UBA7669]